MKQPTETAKISKRKAFTVSRTTAIKLKLRDQILEEIGRLRYNCDCFTYDVINSVLTDVRNIVINTVEEATAPKDKNK